ncbi:hypothetical protein AB4Z22_43995, partial [Paenibacillus sp. TAF58]
MTVRVVRDFNANGKWDPTLPRMAAANVPDQVNEPGVAGIVVELFDSAGHSVQATTDDSGLATFQPGSTLTGEKFRVEASIPSSLSSYLQPAVVNPAATGDGVFSPLTTTVDAPAGTDQQVTMGVWNPNDYTGDDPTVLTSV